ncbi:hypothetical protein BDP55DRAFT_710633 [Colletotrichum godetiae]|uniref:Uncharacterized protein n=1 Tax=Colletotrichum godetiae TaxID=1209918 RepID=A0AAJ0AX93_9PEZI|nr:uncharacterized protein BDP55DRAFT_710633 [Colletotrichum godetiae]KAK1699962.1 hypothetical protein BDP55DRAFT_710633 [Colletotrichum godetiae]
MTVGHERWRGTARCGAPGFNKRDGKTGRAEKAASLGRLTVGSSAHSEGSTFSQIHVMVRARLRRNDSGTLWYRAGHHKTSFSDQAQAPLESELPYKAYPVSGSSLAAVTLDYDRALIRKRKDAWLPGRGASRPRPVAEITATPTRGSRGTGQSQPESGSPTSTVLCIHTDTDRQPNTDQELKRDRAIQCPIRRSRCEHWDGLGQGERTGTASNKQNSAEERDMR